MGSRGVNDSCWRSRDGRVVRNVVDHDRALSDDGPFANAHTLPDRGVESNERALTHDYAAS